MSSPKKKSKTAKERRQEREKEILSKQVSRAQVIAELDKYIRDSSTATVALNALVEKGCNRERILWHLYQFCGGNPADADAVKSAFASRRESLLKVSEHLTGILSELETAKIYLSDVGFEYTYPQNFIDMIPSVAESIRELAKRAVGRFASQRTSGRDHHLVFLVNMIKNVTGGEHYKEVEELVHTTRIAYDPTCTKTQNAEALRKLVDRNRPKEKRPRRTARRPARKAKS